MADVIDKSYGRGACSDCGYRAWLQQDGTVPPHEVRRVQRVGGKVQVYKGTENGDEACTGAGQLPLPMPPRATRLRSRAGATARSAAA